MERDLGEFREQRLQHRTDSMQFYDDALVVKLNGPSTVAEFAEGTADPRVELTPLSRACASRWRALCGARFGHVSAKATAAALLAKQRKPGKFAGTVRGVLSAARLAVGDARRRRRANANVVHSGAGTAQSALWNESMRTFQNTSRHNIPGTTQTRLRPGDPFINPAGVHLGARRAAKARPLARTHPYAKVAIVGAGELLLRDCLTLSGPHRCEEADLVVVPDLSFLHDVDRLAAEVDLAISFLYIVSLGVDITTQTQLAAVQGVPGRLSPQHCVRHVPAMETEVTFCVDPRLVLEQKDVQKALRRIARAPNSEFTLTKKSNPEAGVIFIGELRDVVSWACSVRRVQNEAGPKAFAADGHAMPA